MSRDLLPEQFHVKTRNCMDKNRAIVKMLTEFGIYVHDEDHSEDESICEYNDCFTPDHNLIVDCNHLAGSPSADYDRLSIGELLEAYGKIE